MKSVSVTLACVAALTAATAPVFAKTRPQAAPAAAPAAPAAPTGPTGPGEGDWRTPDPQNVLVIDTSKGRILVELEPLAAPLHVQRVKELARAHFYDGLTFFRVLEGFMDQTGDPNNNGTGGSDKPNLPPEFMFRRGADTPFVSVGRGAGTEWGFLNSMAVVSQPMDLAMMTADHKVAAFGPFCQGVIGAARAEDPASANSQFYLMRDPAHSLDQKYTAFGAVISGLDVVRAIKAGPDPSGAVPDPKDSMTTVRVLADLPEAQRPKVRVLDPRGPWFQVLAAKARKDKVIELGPCDVDLISEVK
ncbi:peptidylprolyl isomerase [Caulobacter sp. KR2-114]|uniref:peptidylprolyl isomerase n=1 Tax=Caulobacter sp. KR2-114 TaxID=3400912 RepID=UPI003C0E0907